MNITEPKNDTPTLYPFRLDEAKLNKGNVVTREGELWTYESHHPSSDAAYRVKGQTATRYTYWFENGSWFQPGTDHAYDLFMTTPEPLPAQAPEEQEVTYLPLKMGQEIEVGDGWFEDGKFLKYANKIGNKSLGPALTFRPINITSLRAEIERLKGELENWQSTAHMRQGQLEASRRQLQQSQEQVASLDRERDEARTLLQEVRAMLVQSSLDLVGARDSLRHMNSRAESAEARIATLEGELAAVTASRKEYMEMYSVQRDHVMRLTASPALTWIPVSTPPTEGDADKLGQVWIPSTTPFHPVGTIHYSNVVPGGYKLWMKPIPLPPTSPPEEEMERKAAQKAYDEYVESAPSGRVATFNDFFLGWQAALKGAQS